MNLTWPMEANERLRKARAAGKITIIGDIGLGPDAGGTVVCITKRDVIRDSAKRWTQYRDRAQFAPILASVRNTISIQLSDGIGYLTPSTDKAFMDDLAILMAAKLVLGPDVVAGSGLSGIMIAVEEDEGLPWNKRGFLSASDAATAPVGLPN